LRQVDGQLGRNAAGPRRHNGDPGRQINRFENAVSDENDGRPAVGPQPQQIIVERHSGDLVEGGERLVEQQQVGVGNERAGDRDAHAHAAGKLPRIGPFEPGEADGADLRGDPRALGRPHSPGQPEGEQHIVCDCAPRHQGRVLEHEADAPRGDIYGCDALGVARCER